MAAKVKCPKCGAKNALDVPRCRVCTAMINPHASADRTAPAGPSRPSSGLEDHFDAGEINRQIQPARSRFGYSGSGGGLSARIAAANGGTMPPSVFGTGQTPTGPGARESSSAAAPSETLSSSPAPPPQANEEPEPFDADALFRDMHSPG